MRKRLSDLEAEHRPAAIRSRLEGMQQHSYVGDALLAYVVGAWLRTTFGVE